MMMYFRWKNVGTALCVIVGIIASVVFVRNSAVLQGIVAAVIAVVSALFIAIDVRQQCVRDKMLRDVEARSAEDVLNVAELLNIHVSPAACYYIQPRWWNDFSPFVFGVFLGSVLHIKDAHGVHEVVAKQLGEKSEQYQKWFLEGFGSRHPSRREMLVRALEARKQQVTTDRDNLKLRKTINSGLKACNVSIKE